jgi:hypothetical protein
MKNKIAVSIRGIAIIIMLSCQKKITEKDEETLSYLKEIEWPTAYREQDTILLDRILSENFQLIDQSGDIYSKNDELNWIKEHAMEHDSFFYEIKRLEIFENGTAIIAGTSHIFNDTTYSTYESSNVLIKRDNVWKAVLSHVSAVKNLE